MKANEWVLRQLGGLALKEVQDIVCDTTSPENIYTELKDLFGDKRPLPTLHSNFHNFQQRPAEDIVSYASLAKDINIRDDV